MSIDPLSPLKKVKEKVESSLPEPSDLKAAAQRVAGKVEGAVRAGGRALEQVGDRLELDRSLGSKVTSGIASLLGNGGTEVGEVPSGKLKSHAPIHSHNDELRKRPLADAVRAGASSVEVDTFLDGDRLVVGHGERLAKLGGRSLEDYYLKPLHRYFQKHGRIYPDRPLTLEVEFKKDGDASYAQLEKLMERYKPMLTRYENGKKVAGAVEIVLTGNLPKKALEQNPRYVAFDGQISQLQRDPQGVDASRTPRLNGKWENFFQWNGKGPMPAEQFEKLKELSQKAQERGVELRFWDAPDTPAAWKALLKAGVGLVSTDHPADLAEFIENHTP